MNPTKIAVRGSTAVALTFLSLAASAMEDRVMPMPADRPIPGFDAQYYYSKYPDLQRAIGNNPAALLDHFRKHGQNELRAPSRAGDAGLVSYAQWAEGCNKGQWGGIQRIVTYGKKIILNDRLQSYCDEQVYRYAKAYDAFVAPGRSAHGKPFMRAGDWLTTDQYLVSEGNHFHAVMQGDGNFCIYQGASPQQRHGTNKWCTMRAPGKGQYFAVLQHDANFCVYKGAGPSNNQGLVWCASHKSQSINPPYYFMVLQNDNMREPNLAIYRGSAPNNQWGHVWDRITAAPPKPDSAWEKMYKGLQAVGNKMIELENMKQGKPPGG